MKQELCEKGQEDESSQDKIYNFRVNNSYIQTL